MQHITVEIRPCQWGDGIRASAGAWADAGPELDEWLKRIDGRTAFGPERRISMSCSRTKVILAYAAVVGLWLPALLIVVGGAALEQSLEHLLAGGRFRSLAFTNALQAFCMIHTLLTASALLLVANRRLDLTILLYAGPFLATLMLIASETWFDPDWRTINAVLCIGEAVGLVVTFVCWLIGRIGAASPKT